MDAEVKHSGPKVCMSCGNQIRIKYVNGEFHAKVDIDPIPGTEDKNPIYQLHNCESESSGN